MVPVGRYIALRAEYEDDDVQRRICEDLPDDIFCQDTACTTFSNYDVEDAPRYGWSITTSNGSANALVVPSCTESATIFFASDPGTYDVCVQIDADGVGIDPSVYESAAVIAEGLPVYVAGHGVMAGSATLLPPCAGIIACVNDDDDNMDGVRDAWATVASPSDQELYEIAITYTGSALPSATISLSIEGPPLEAVLRDAAGAVYVERTPFTVTQGIAAIFYLDCRRRSQAYATNSLVVKLEAGVSGGAYDSIERIPLTSFGITQANFVEGQMAGYAFVQQWSGLAQERLRPPGYWANSGMVSPGEHYWCDPGVVPHLDDATSLTPETGELWSLSRRNRVKARIVVEPVSPWPIDLTVALLDVDDASYGLYGDMGEGRREFMDPFDRGVQPAAYGDAARHDNYGRVATTSGDTSHGGVINSAGQVAMHATLAAVQGVCDVTVICSYAPGDNYRLVASLVTTHIGQSPSVLLSAIPADSGLAASYSEAVERACKIVYRREVGDVQQLGAGAFPDAVDVAVASPQGHVAAVSKTLTVRRRLWVEVLRPDVPTSEWNLSCDSVLENQLIPMTRYIVSMGRITNPNCQPQPRDFEFMFRFNDDRWTGPGSGVPPLVRHISEDAVNTFIPSLPMMQPLGIRLECVDLSSAYTDIIAAAPLRTFQDLGWPHSFASFPLGIGRLSRDEGGNIPSISTHGGTDFGEVMSQTNESLWVRLWGAELDFRVEIKRPTDAGWVEIGLKEMRLDEVSGDTRCVPWTDAGAPALPYPIDTQLRLRPVDAPAGWQQVVQTVASDGASFTVAADANGISFRVPVLLRDGTSSISGVNDHFDAMSVEASIAGQAVMHYPSALLAEACVGVEVLDPPYGAPMPWRQHVVEDATFGGILSVAGTWLQHSRLLQLGQLANERCWTLAVGNIPDWYWWKDSDPFAVDGNGDNAGEMLYGWAHEWTEPLRYALPAAYPESGLPVVEMAPWVMCDSHSYDDAAQGPFESEYSRDQIAGVSVVDVYKARVGVHEILHALLPSANVMPMGADPVMEGPGWELYGQVVNPGPPQQQAGPGVGMHSIPGVTSYDLEQDPVSSPNVVVSNGGIVENAAHSECRLSPYAVRWLRARSRGPSVLPRPWNN